LFWRRRNARFVKRLHTVIETYEHVRKSFRRQPPRVIIDTSFLTHSTAREAAAPASADRAAQDVPLPDASGNAINGPLPVHEMLAAADAERDAAQLYETEVLAREAAVREQAAAERAHANCLQAELRHEQIARLEAEDDCNYLICEKAAAQRELSMLSDAVELHKLALAKEAEARLRTTEAMQELEALRAMTARLKAAVEEEAAARQKAEMALEAASKRACEVQRALTDLQAMAAHHEHVDGELEARQREGAARNEIAALRNEAADLEAEIKDHQATRRTAEARRAECEQSAMDAERELGVLLTAADEHELAEQRALQGRERELAASREAEAAGERVVELRERVCREKTTRIEAEERRDAAARRASEVQRELAAVHEAAERRALAEQQAAQAREREQAAQRQAQEQRELAARLATQAERELTQRRAAEAERETQARLEAEARRALVALQEVEAARTQAAVASIHDNASGCASTHETVDNDATSSDHHSRVARPATANNLDLTTQVNARWFIKSTREIDSDTDEASAGPQTSRRDQRMNSHTPSTLHGSGISQPLQCTMLDRSASGALLEFAPDRYINEITELFVGDELTLTFGTTQDRTSVSCQVIWIRARRCGVRFCGQFQAQINKPRRVVRDKPVVEKAKPMRPARTRLMLGSTGKSKVTH
jgi:hypothetical protein